MFTKVNWLLFALTMTLAMNLSQASSSEDLRMIERGVDESDSEDVQEQRRSYDFDQLRRFLLTSNAEQRAAKREKQEFQKRQLIREYLQAISDSDLDRFQEVKKRFKTYCNSYEDLMNSNWAACG